MQRNIREKKHRLPFDSYKGFVAAAFTANICERKRLFVKASVFRIFQEILLKELNNQHCSSYAYLFMPDHFHIIIAGESDTANVKKCMDMFKQRTGFWLYKNCPEFCWQKDYYDHVIRNEQDMSQQIRYIFQNPVRAGITDSWKKHPYKGSTKFRIEDWEEEM